MTDNTVQSGIEAVDSPPSTHLASPHRVTGFLRRQSFVLQVAGITLLLAAVLVGFAWWQTGSIQLVWSWLRGQRLLLEPTEIVLADVRQNVIVEKQIRVVNVSSRPMTLLGSQPTCYCIAVGEFPVVVPPGKEYYLNVKISTSAQEGPFAHLIKFFTDEPGYSPIVVTISGSIQ